MTTCQKPTPTTSLEQEEPRMTDEEEYRAQLAAMTYEEWLEHHRAAPGGWLTTAAPADLLRVAYEQRLAVFDEMNNEDTQESSATAC